MKEITILVVVYVVCKVALDILGDAKVASGKIDAETARRKYNLPRLIASALRGKKHGHADNHNDPTVS